MIRRVLLTGATGFLGSRILGLLLEQGLQVRAFALPPHPPDERVDWLDGDVTDAATCRQAVAEVDAVIHAAGVLYNRRLLWPVNVTGTENMLAAAAAASVQRFVHVSSVGVIGADPLQARVFDEDAACVPRNEYEQSKWSAEQRVQEAVAQGLPAAIVRPANVFR